MIPTMIVVGLVLGRWWRTALVIGLIAWPLLLLGEGIIDRSDVAPAAALGLANTAVGVAVHQGALHLARRISNP